jgi:hypothetical protein
MEKRYVAPYSNAHLACGLLSMTYNTQSSRESSSFEHYRGADKSLARPTPRCILFDGENISFDVSLVIYK